MIFCVHPGKGKASASQYMTSFFAYAQHFDIVPQQTLTNGKISCQKLLTVEPWTGMYILKCTQWSDGTNMGDIILLGHVKALVDLVPCFGAVAEKQLMKETSLEYSSEF